MTDRHLTPLELDLLVDGIAGPEAARWRAHLDGCAACRARHTTQARIAATVETLPHLAPPPRLAEAVMARVSVERPVPVALVEGVRHAARVTAPWHRLLVIGAGVGAVGVTLGVVAMLSSPTGRHVVRDAGLTLGNSLAWTVSEGMSALAPVAVGLGVATLGLGLLAARARRRMG
jgi:anti-sigma factor RsiW